MNPAVPSAKRGLSRRELMMVIGALLVLIALRWRYMLLDNHSRIDPPVGFVHSQINTFATALDMYEVDNGSYPVSLNDLVVRQVGATNWHQYLSEIPLDPWGHPYIYKCPGQHRPNSYDLSSMGPDGRAGTDDDIVNWQNGK